MERLVISYTTDGGYDCGSYDHVLPVVYESKDKLIADFKDIVIGYWFAYEDHRDKEKKWTSKEPRYTATKDEQKLEKYATRYTAWLDNQPVLKQSEDFKIGDIEFYAMDFIVSGDYSPPTIQTLDEWFSV
jgi:hypothetical protein